MATVVDLEVTGATSMEDGNHMRFTLRDRNRGKSYWLTVPDGSDAYHALFDVLGLGEKQVAEISICVHRAKK